MTGLMCASVACRRIRDEGSAYCFKHGLTAVLDAADAEYEAARMDPTTDRDRWDVWDDGGLERPGGDEF